MYQVVEGVRELHGVALTLVIIVHSERMSYSEPRKALNFPQREKEGVSKTSIRWRKRTDGVKKRSDRMSAK